MTLFEPDPGNAGVGIMVTEFSHRYNMFSPQKAASTVIILFNYSVGDAL